MTHLPILGCAVNASEGRRPEVIRALVDAASPAAALDVSSDPDHNRTVLTLAGPGPDLVDAADRLAATAVRTIDLNGHDGVHPRTGALDLVPFYPLRATPRAAAVDAARLCAYRIWSRHRVPVFFYESAALRPEARALPWVRRHAFVDHLPDVGGPEPHPTAGAVVVGARDLLVAYNVVLAAPDPAAARAIASEIRQAWRGRIRALGLALPSRQLSQVSLNLLEPRTIRLADAYREVSHRARAHGVPVAGSEIVGLVPRACLGDTDPDELQLAARPRVLEDVVDAVLGVG